MQMIDVLKRLAELDATTPAIDTGAAVVRPEQGVTLAECGPMGMMDSMGGMGQPHTPASINMTAATGDELSGMLKDIMSLAGINKDEPEQFGIDVEPMALTAEPEVGPDAGAGPGATDGEVMRSVLDKLNPEDGKETPFGGDDGVSKAHGDIDGDGDHDMDDHDAEKPQAGADDEEDDQEETDETYDGPQYSTTPNDPNKDRQGYDEEGVGPNNHENQPGAGNTMFGKSRTRVQPTATYEGLMKEYKAFIGESEETDEDVEEGIEDRLKDLDPKNPVNIPAYQRKAASGDSASAAKNTKEGATEKFDPLKHIKNPTQGEKDAAKLVKRGSYADRAALNRSAENDGRLKSESANESMADILKLSGLR
jgi:hypothetical protein